MGPWIAGDWQIHLFSNQTHIDIEGMSKYFSLHLKRKEKNNKKFCNSIKLNCCLVKWAPECLKFMGFAIYFYLFFQES